MACGGEFFPNPFQANSHRFNCALSVPGVIKTSAVLDIETKSHYWLTVFAQDHGVVPLYSSVEVIPVSFVAASPQKIPPATYHMFNLGRFCA
jgi:hypothetical protein